MYELGAQDRISCQCFPIGDDNILTKVTSHEAAPPVHGGCFIAPVHVAVSSVRAALASLQHWAPVQVNLKEKHNLVMEGLCVASACVAAAGGGRSKVLTFLTPQVLPTVPAATTRREESVSSYSLLGRVWSTLWSSVWSTPQPDMSSTSALVCSPTLTALGITVDAIAVGGHCELGSFPPITAPTGGSLFALTQNSPRSVSILRALLATVDSHTRICIRTSHPLVLSRIVGPVRVVEAGEGSSWGRQTQRTVSYDLLLVGDPHAVSIGLSFALAACPTVKLLVVQVEAQLSCGYSVVTHTLRCVPPHPKDAAVLMSCDFEIASILAAKWLMADAARDSTPESSRIVMERIDVLARKVLKVCWRLIDV